MMKSRIALLLLILCLGVAPSLWAGDDQSASITGTTYDNESGDPLGFVYLHLVEIGRTATAHDDGYFEFKNVPAGEYTLQAHRIGYRTQTRSVTVESGEELKLEVRLKPTVMSTDALEVVGERQKSASSLENASRKMTGSQLRNNLSSSLAQTMEGMPGFDSRTMGNAPARPIIRGLGGERVLILQDGERTNDVSAQSADHAVTIDPMAADEIEIARGPAALAYGGNAIGGVVNVVKNQIASSVASHAHGTLSLQSQSVNYGTALAGELIAPVGSFALTLDGSLRNANEIKTPVGRLTNSGLLATNSSLGASYVRPWGHAGAAVNLFINNYGIPPDPNGGHPNGVDVEMRKYQLEGGAEQFFDSSFLKSAQYDYTFTNYFHRELESSGVIGTEFGQVTHNASVRFKHGSAGLLQQGSFGIWAQARDYAVFGASTPDSDAYEVAGYLIEEKDFGPLHLEAGSRVEFILARPEQERTSNLIGEIRERRFTGWANSVSATYGLGRGFFVGSMLMHSFRAPSLEELFSEGPHLASYSFEIGNPDLDPERGFGKELFLRYRGERLDAQITGFHNGFQNFLFPRNTGIRAVNQGRPNLNLFQYKGADAQLYGFESQFQAQLNKRWLVSGSASYTHAIRDVTQTEIDAGELPGQQPLPMIPPFKANLEVGYSVNELKVGIRTRMAAEQSRTGDFEEPTDGYIVGDIYGQYQLSMGGMLHTFSLSIRNVTNQEYRNHLSRIKEIIPEPARNVSLLYRVYF